MKKTILKDREFCSYLLDVLYTMTKTSHREFNELDPTYFFTVELMLQNLYKDKASRDEIHHFCWVYLYTLINEDVKIISAADMIKLIDKNWDRADVPKNIK